MLVRLAVCAANVPRRGGGIPRRVPSRAACRLRLLRECPARRRLAAPDSCAVAARSSCGSRPRGLRWRALAALAAALLPALSAARASPCASLGGLRGLGAPSVSSVLLRGGSPLFPPAARMARLPPFSPSGACAPLVRYFIRGDKGFALCPRACGARRCGLCPRLASPLALVCASACGCAACRPLPRRVRARFAARPRRLVAGCALVPVRFAVAMKGASCSPPRCDPRAPATAATARGRATGSDAASSKAAWVTLRTRTQSTRSRKNGLNPSRTVTKSRLKISDRRE